MPVFSNNDMMILNKVKSLIGTDEHNLNLKKYLEGLSHDEVKMVRTTMYVGRNEKNDRTNDPSQVIFDETLAESSQLDKSLEIDSIVSKSSEALKNYINDGIDILKEA